MVCAALSSQPFATMLLMFSMYYSLAAKVGAQKRSPYSVLVLVFIAAVSAIGVALVPYSSMILFATSIMATAVQGMTFNIPLICGVNFLVTAAFIVIGAIFLKVLMVTNILKVEFDMSNAGELVSEKAVFDTKVKWGFFYIILLVALMLVPTFLPAAR